MKFFTMILASMPFAFGATIGMPLHERGDSGCIPFEDPDCGINYAVCSCSNDTVNE
ncbi:hypothetical protein M436DRAFT_58982 [Aureobasidium namibiae CBS 147.97]|uniref:Uncharacterized protein n=1 Tax=Aureobasidium namibiae CBS 147.97 TaxID=1043004 RepID=A0A074W9A9_9PEZI|nr:uncharacterized protein M436DRAFT_58982 [Aureobasidium namibiae CBS 147.97]KEQ68189.1 hypothetical protein M436DRAFT_58982 [Aureobasidium namibiae CBS 147.97]